MSTAAAIDPPVIDPPDADAPAVRPPARSRNYNIICLSEALSPISHAARTEGNQSVLLRDEFVTERGVARPPKINGNAIRHRAVRAPGYRWLVDEYGLAGTLTLPQLNFAFHGGSLTEGGGREDTARIADFQRLFPLGRLLGGCLPDQILAGNLQVWIATLVCEENRRYLEAILGPDRLPARLRPAESCVTDYQYVRGDAIKTRLDLARADEPGRVDRAEVLRGEAPDRESGRRKLSDMPFAGQSVMRGSVFLHGFTLPHANVLELGALLWSLRLWQAAGGTLGGQSARGHGRLALSIVARDVTSETRVVESWETPDGPAADTETEILADLPVSAGELHEAATAYVAHARSVRDEAVAWLHSVFAPKAGKAGRASGKGKGGKGKADSGSELESSEDGPSLLPGD